MTTLLRIVATNGIVLITLACASSLHAQSASLKTQQLAEMYHQMQQLQREVMELRGVVEEQAYRIRKLERQRVADYQSLDQRLQAMGAATAAGSAATAAPKMTVVDTAAAIVPSASAASAAAAEEAAYKSAFALLKKQQLAEAEGAFRQYLEDYPTGKFSGNAYYWLGELNLTQDNLLAASDAFGTLVDRYPKHRKVPESTYKLAMIHQRQGQSAEAEALLNKIVSEYSALSPPTVNKANNYLDKHFR